MYVLDTSAVIDGRIISMVKAGEIKGEIIIPNQVLAELEHQANTQRETGFAGISVIRELKSMDEVQVSFQGQYPSRFQVERAKDGAIDSAIRDIAKELGATLITGDRVQAQMAKATDVLVIFLQQRPEDFSVPFQDYFDPYTQSVHLKEFCIPLAKKGSPGNIKLVQIGTAETSPKEIRILANRIIELAKQDFNSFIELDAKEATIIQLREYRIVLTKPPFSDSYEITIVKPIVRKKLMDYSISPELLKRIDERAEGILICGSPGMGKSTFAAALAEYYLEKGKIIKTVESPRDLQVPKDITQYALRPETYDLITDIILLVRPDYCIYDEIRKTSDFGIFADLRLAGIGLIGVVHATFPIDAIQRFIGRVELGIIPQIVDTVIYIHSGNIQTVFTMKFTVKVPSGMFESDLARPVIEVRDESTGAVAYEIYTFGEETVVIPVADQSPEKKADHSKALKDLERIMGKITRQNFHAEISNGVIRLFVHPKDMPSVIGKKGKTISSIEKRVGMRIKVEEA